MAKIVRSQNRFVNGISDFLKEGQPESFSFSRAIDTSNPRQPELQPKAIKESGSVVVDLPKWGEQVPDGNTYVIGDAGTFYKRTTTGSWLALRTVSNCHGNGLGYFAEDQYVYYTGDKAIGRYGPLTSATPQFSDDFLGAQGGVRLNTYSATLVAASSQYASKTDSASLSITGDLSMECYINPTTLPTTGNSMILMSKWRSGNNTRSYKFDIAGVSAVFGSAIDGNLTISADTTDAPIDSACTGTNGSNSLSATNASFAAGQEILIHQSQGTNAGIYQRNKIVSYTAGTIILDKALNQSYTTGAQVLVLKQYGNVTVNSGKTWTAKAWNGTTGGILAFLCNGTLTVTGTINATGKGFRGGTGNAIDSGDDVGGQQGESELGVGSSGVNYYVRNGAGGGAGNKKSGYSIGAGAGGGNGIIGSNGGGGVPSQGGNSIGNNSLTSMFFGGAGGGGQHTSSAGGFAGTGGNGGGIIFAYASTISVSGSIISGGDNGGTSDTNGANAGAGAGAGGSILLKCLTASIGSSLITASGGSGAYGNSATGGNGGSGRIHIDYYTSVTGTTTPTLDSTQDNNLSTNTTYQLRLWISSNGTVEEILARTCSLTTGVWKHVAVTWDASASLATFYLNGNSLGTSTGAYTSISDNGSSFLIGSQDTDLGSYFDGKIDECRLWGVIRTENELIAYKDIQIPASTANLKGYWQLNNNWNDLTSNNNNLTASGSPTFTDDVPFLSPTTRNDIDISQTSTGQTYTVPTTITENSANTVYFTPTKDPLKSISVLIAAKGTGNWTLSLQDANSVVIENITITNANLISGIQNEFFLTTPLRPLPNATYHFHLTSTVADGTVTTATTADLSTVDYKTYFQFLIEDTAYHPVGKMLQFLVIGNERYVATYEATLYDPNKITLPAGWRVRCFGLWREYLVIGCMKGTNIYDFDNGRVYFWDGISTTYNFFIDVPEGGINAVFGSKGRLYIWAGYQGDMLIYQGGDTADKIKRLPNSTPDKYIEVYPGAVTMWKSILHFGVGNSDSTTFQRGVYTYGALNIRYNDSMSFDFVNSNGTYGSTVKVGLVMTVNRKLLIGWQDGVSYGIDYVDANNAPAPSGTIEGIVQDEGLTWKTKEALTAVATFLPLRTGESVAVKYRLDRNDNWTSSPIMSTVGATQVKTLISPTGKARCKEYQWAVDLYSTGTTSPQLLNVGIEVDTLETEKTFGE